MLYYSAIFCKSLDQIIHFGITSVSNKSVGKFFFVIWRVKVFKIKFLWNTNLGHFHKVKINKINYETLHLCIISLQYIGNTALRNFLSFIILSPVPDFSFLESSQKLCNILFYSWPNFYNLRSYYKNY